MGFVYSPTLETKEGSFSGSMNGVSPRTGSARSISVDGYSMGLSSRDEGVVMKPTQRHNSPIVRKLSNGNSKTEENRGQDEDNARCMLVEFF